MPTKPVRWRRGQSVVLLVLVACAGDSGSESLISGTHAIEAQEDCCRHGPGRPRDNWDVESERQAVYMSVIRHAGLVRSGAEGDAAKCLVLTDTWWWTGASLVDRDFQVREQTRDTFRGIDDDVVCDYVFKGQLETRVSVAFPDHLHVERFSMLGRPRAQHPDLESPDVRQRYGAHSSFVGFSQIGFNRGGTQALVGYYFSYGVLEGVSRYVFLCFDAGEWIVCVVKDVGWS